MRGVVAALLLTATVPLAAQRPSMPTAHPDFSGYWELRMDSFSVPRAALTAQAAAGVEAQTKRDTDALSRCTPIGMPALMDDRSTLDIRHAPTVLAMVAKSPSSTRYIYTDGRNHPPADELEGTTNGHSIGRWEGETLVVDTVAFNTRGVTRIPGGGYRTGTSRLVERYRLLDDGQRLSVIFTWDDPSVFQQPHAYEFRYYRARNVSEPRVLNCVANAERTRFLNSDPGR